jgi:hypothetical protein
MFKLDRPMPTSELESFKAQTLKLQNSTPPEKHTMTDRQFG